MPDPSAAVSFLRKLCPTISVGVMTADWMNLTSEIQEIEAAGVKLLHYDVMDGLFCPGITVGPPIVKATETTLLKDVHLMVNDPLSCIDSFVAAGADIVTVHAESGRHTHRALQMLGQMKNANAGRHGLERIVRGVALNPGTPAEVLPPLLDDLDFILLLAVNPGWSGQSFIPSTENKFKQVKRLIAESGHDILVGIDGGVTQKNIRDIAKSDVDLIVTGSAVYDKTSPRDNAAAMLKNMVSD
jgi:ribulose-phosphate 3-epimerase